MFSSNTSQVSNDAVFVEDVFSTWLYTGNGSTQTITNGIDLSGKGGLLWIKNRGAAYNNYLADTVTGQYLFSDATSKAYPSSPYTSFGSSGFSLVDPNNYYTCSASGQIGVSWTFRKQPKFFDVVTWTGNGSNRTISHNLGSVPGCIMVKRTDTTGAWAVYHRSLANTEYLVLNTTVAKATGATYWNSTTATSTDFSLGTATDVNANGGTYVAYLFAHNAGGFGLTGTDNVISCGSYTGNANINGPTITLGYEPQWLLIKNASSGTTNWVVYDNMRGLPVGSNPSWLYPNTSDAEVTASWGRISPTATGFKVETNDAYQNGSGETMIYIAIRRGPMKTPTSGTSVFSPVTQTSRGTVTAGFPVDAIIMGDRGSSWGYNWSMQDRLRGNAAVLFTSGTAAENTTATSSFASNTTFTDGWVSGGVSAVYESFRRAPGFFDVVCYTGDNNSSLTAKNHNLTVAPELIIIKSRGTGQWWTNVPSGLSNQLMNINSSSAAITGGSWSFTATTFAYNNSGLNSVGVNYVAYLFASLPGISKVGSYTGSGTTKQIDCGFTGGARFVLIKRTDSTGDWYVWDSARGIVAGNDPYLLLNSTAAEVTTTDYVDTYSAGFEISSTAPAAINANGGSFIYLAIA